MAEMLFPLQIKKQYAASIDSDYAFDTYVDLDNFKSDPIAYSGMLAYAKDRDGKLFILNNAKTAWIELSGGSGLTMVEDYTKLPSTMTSDSIYFVKNSYEDTSVSPSVIYSNGFYLWDNSEITPNWKLISSSNDTVTKDDIDGICTDIFLDLGW